ncbi:MAG: hypothetical protein PHT94_02205 [Candidatus Nanoarchaeia archaeon]|nr:hypothetical protein [Candidatus Nanoarchaeia archaeon]
MKTDNFVVIKRSIFLIILFIIVSMIFFYNVPLKNEVNLVAVNLNEDNNITGGSVIKFEIEMKNGEGKNYLDIASLTKFDTQYSLRYAKNFACEILNKNCESYDFYYKINANSGIIGGPSAGSAMTLAFLSTINSKKIPKDVAITGFISAGGWIGPVGGIEEKIKASKKENMTRIFIPKSERIIDGKDLVDEYSNKDFKVIPVENIFELYREIFDEEVVVFEKKIHEEPYVKQLKIISEDICSISEKLLNEINSSKYKEINDFFKESSIKRESISELLNFYSFYYVDLYEKSEIVNIYFKNISYKKHNDFFCSLENLSFTNTTYYKDFCLPNNILKIDEMIYKSELRPYKEINITFIEEYQKDKIVNLTKSFKDNYDYYILQKTNRSLFEEKILKLTRLSNIYSYYKEGVSLIQRGDKFFNQDYYYASSSSCFGANLDLDYYNYVLEIFDDKLFNISSKDFSNQAIYFKLNMILRDIEFDLLSYKIDLGLSIENPQIDYVINSRYQDALSSFYKVRDKINELNVSKYENQTIYTMFLDISSIIYDLTYSKNRFLTSKQWSKFKDLEEYNNESEKISYFDLYNSCNDAYNYAKIDFEYIKENSGSEIYKEDLNTIKENMDNGLFYSCIFNSINLRSIYSNLMAISATKDLEQLFNEKEALAYYYLNKNQNEFPLLSYSYLEYARALKDQDIYSALNYLEESIGFNNIDIYSKDILDLVNKSEKDKTENQYFRNMKIIIMKYEKLFYFLIILSLILELLFYNLNRYDRNQNNKIKNKINNKLDNELNNKINNETNNEIKSENDFENYLLKNNFIKERKYNVIKKNINKNIINNNDKKNKK